MINKLGFDIYNYIISFLINYEDIISIKNVNKFTYYNLYCVKEIELKKIYSNIIDLPYLEKIKIYNIVIIIPNIKICILSDCSIRKINNTDNIRSLHIQDCYSFSNVLSYNTYNSLIALYLYNFMVDPDDLILPNLEYLCLYESDYDDSYIYMFNIQRFPKLKYLDICKIYIDNDSATVPSLEYYAGRFEHYNMPKLKYLEWPSEDFLLPEYFYITNFPNLTTIITNQDNDFNIIKVIKPDYSKIAQNYYNMYFSI